jgi:hypothetical protein
MYRENPLARRRPSSERGSRFPSPQQQRERDVAAAPSALPASDDDVINCLLDAAGGAHAGGGVGERLRRVLSLAEGGKRALADNDPVDDYDHGARYETYGMY